jgi:polyphosphate kinase
MVETVKAAKKAGREARNDLTDSALYINRELSLLEFQHRVLANASQTRHPLLERVKFLAHASRNIDEFFMVRVSDLQDQIEAGLVQVPPDGMTPAQQLAAIRKRCVRLQQEQRRVLCEHLLPELGQQGIRMVGLHELTAAQRAGLRTYFDEQVFPVLTPLAVDPGHPFPHISNLSINLAVELQGEGIQTRFARVKIPDVFPRLLHVEAVLGQHVNGKRTKYTFVWLDELVAVNLSSLFPGVPVLAIHSFRVVRDADIEIHEEEGSDLRISVERSLSQRRFGEPVALFVETAMPESMRSILLHRLNLGQEDMYAVDTPLGLDSVMQLSNLDRPDLKYPPHVPRLPPFVAASETILGVLDRHDILVHHPYDSFAPIVDFLQTGVSDDEVLAIKQTLYRVGTASPVVAALLDAAHHGKQVAVLIELKARFDEASNIEWARELERAGVHVVYGFYGLKTHAKVALVVRRERGGIRRYVHVGSGNYNAAIARGYTDVGLFTADPDFGADATDLFNYLTGYSEQKTYRRFLVGPLTVRKGLIERIDREIRHHQKNGDGHIIFKMNHLADFDSMRAIYRASQAGVKVDLIVRTISCIRPGIQGVSENIRVRSLVGRFLEHARIYYFRNAGDPEVYVGSADLLPRNLDHRVEVLFPILDSDIRDRVVRTILEAQLRDTANAWKQETDGSYVRIEPANGDAPFDSQAWAIEHG